MGNVADARESKKGALELLWYERFGLGFVGVAAAVAAWLVLPMYRTSAATPDLLLGVLAIGALILIPLATIGRLPRSFELAGIEISLDRAGLSDFIGTIKSTLDDDPDSCEVLLEKLRHGVGDRRYRQAERALSQESSVMDRGERLLAPEEELARPETQDPPQNIPLDGEFSNVFGDAVTAKENYEVPDSGKGKRPIYDYLVVRDDGVCTAVEKMRYWNPTTVSLAQRKAARSLLKGTPVDRIVLLSPREGISSFREAFRTNPRVEVIESTEALLSGLRILAARSRGIAPASPLQQPDMSTS